MGRDFWILFVPMVVGLGAAIVSLALRSGFPLVCAMTYAGAHGMIYYRRLAPYTTFQALGFGEQPYSPLWFAIVCGIIMCAGAVGIALDVGDWLGVIDVDRRFCLPKPGSFAKRCFPDRL